MAIHDLTNSTVVVDLLYPDDDPTATNWTDGVYDGKPFERGAIFLLAEIRQLLIQLVNK